MTGWGSYVWSSLKKITNDAKLSKINVDPKVANDNEFDRFYRKGVNAADIYMKFKKGVEIQFRGLMETALTLARSKRIRSIKKLV